MRTVLSRPRLATAALGVALLWLSLPISVAHPQYFGRNKVQYDAMHFRIQSTEHFKIYSYPSESLAAGDAARMAQRWYQRHFALFGQSFSGNPLIFYADPPDFQQSNVVEGQIGQGTGGVTEGGRDRVIMPFTGSYAENDHVLGHELVHVFQYRVADSSKGGMRNLNNIPLWLIEGMAEYLSLGRDDPNTAMWLRDALQRNDLPSIKQLGTDPRYFPYRYGQALWAFIGGTWGDVAVNRVYRSAVDHGWERGVQLGLGISIDSLSKQWHAAIRDAYGPTLANRTRPGQMGRSVAIVEHEGDYNVSPTVSPDGKYIAFFSSRGLFGIDLYVAEAATGHVIKQLTSVTTNAHFDALSFISSSGSWSPDGSQLAFVVYAEGDNEIDIMDVSSRETTRRIKVPRVGAISDPAWSPDGKQLAFSGISGGISDLYLFDLTSGVTRQLTHDREAQLQPAWSPDGRTLAFVTDAGPETDFARLHVGPMRLALMDVTTQQMRLLPRFGDGKAINPQFAPDGASIYFVADRDGVSDIYRVTLASMELSRLSHLSTGVTGITALSPALSVARSTGEVFFSVFDRAGFSIRALTSREALGVAIATERADREAGILPPAAALTTSTVEHALHDPDAGLPAPARVATKPYNAALQLESVGGPQVGVSFGGGYGTGLAGGVALGFSDMLGNHILQTVVQAQGSVKDIGGQVLYLNRAHRWNWGAEAYHIPLAGVFASFAQQDFTIGGESVPGAVYTQVLQRVFYDNAQLLTQYPFSATQRLELTGGVQRVSFDTQVDSLYVAGNVVLREARGSLPSGTGLNFATASAALVGDNSFFGFTSPVAGGRYRFEADPYVGSLNYGTLLADYRHYFFMRPFTFAIRGVHYGRYGSDAENSRLQPLFVGQPYLIRGYDPASFNVNECTVQPGSTDQCPQYTRLSGSRIAVANAEFRIPLFGTEQLGLIRFPFLPTEVSPFFDAGVAWSSGQNASLRFDQTTTARVPVFSAGVSTRFNLFGFAVAEVYWAHPFQRPGRSSYIGFQLAPGW